MRSLLLSLVLMASFSATAQYLTPGGPGGGGGGRPAPYPGGPGGGGHGGDGWHGGPGPGYPPPHGGPGYPPPYYPPPAPPYYPPATPPYYPPPAPPYYPPAPPPYYPPQPPPSYPPYNPPPNYGPQCSGDVCVGQRLIAVDSAKDVTIIGVDYNGRFTVRDMYYQVYSNVDRSNLAVTSGSSQGLYVGQEVTAYDSGKRVMIIGIQWNGYFVVRDYNGNVYVNISRSDLSNY